MAPTAVAPPLDTPATPPIELTSRRRSRARTPLLIAASLAAGAAGVLGVQALLPDQTPERSLIASATLEPLPGWEAGGAAVVEEDEGRRVLQVDLPDPQADGYREVWLISSDLTRLISLGVLTGDSGTFDLPDGLDLADFAIVDVSDEPVNGDPSHSGNSIVRGELA